MNRYGWHITYRSNLSDILHDGLFPSEDGYLNSGVYLWKDFSPDDEEGELQVLQNCLDHIFDYLLTAEDEDFQNECERNLEEHFVLLYVKIPEGSIICEEDNMICVNSIIAPSSIEVVDGWEQRYDFLSQNRRM